MILKLGNQHLFCILSSSISPLFFYAYPYEQQTIPLDPQNILLISLYLFHPDPFHLLAQWNDAILDHKTTTVVSTGLFYPLLLLSSLSFPLLLGSLFLLFLGPLDLGLLQFLFFDLFFTGFCFPGMLFVLRAHALIIGELKFRSSLLASLGSQFHI
jgi:hypothetical protein